MLLKVGYLIYGETTAIGLIQEEITMIKIQIKNSQKDLKITLIFCGLLEKNENNLQKTTP